MLFTDNKNVNANNKLENSKNIVDYINLKFSYHYIPNNEVPLKKSLLSENRYVSI